MLRWPADSCLIGPRYGGQLWHISVALYKNVYDDLFMFVKCKKLLCYRPPCVQGHVRKAQALVSLGRTEEALREYLVSLSIEPDCRLAKTEAHKVNPTLVLVWMDRLSATKQFVISLFGPVVFI